MQVETSIDDYNADKYVVLLAVLSTKVGFGDFNNISLYP